MASTGGQFWITTSNSTTTATWTNWNQALYLNQTTGSSVQLLDQQWVNWNMVAEETAEQVAAREAAEAAMRAEWQRQQDEYRERERLKVAARERAEELLLLMLTEEQAASRREHGFFTVLGSRSGKAYRIHDRGQAGNIDRLGDDGRREYTYCAHPPAGLPAADAHLAQMLAIATDEDEFLRVANATPVRLRMVDEPVRYVPPEPPRLIRDAA